MSAFENITGLTDALVVSNTLTGGYLTLGFPVVVFIAIFGYTLAYGRSHAITTASFITMLILLVENMLGMVQYWAIIVTGVLFALGVVMVLMERRGIDG